MPISPSGRTSLDVDYRVEGAADIEGARSAMGLGSGFTGINAREGHSDPFVLLANIAGSLPRPVRLTTSVAVAFARNPMSVAVAANDLQVLSGGRFVLGLGSQIRPHIERRYSMSWSRPAARMREYIVALQNIWRSWIEDEPLRFQGQFYTHTLMPEPFVPSVPYGAPRVLLAAVGEQMTEVAGAVADGVLVHSFTTREFLAERTVPHLHQSAAIHGRDPQALEINGSTLVATGADDESRERAGRALRHQLAFYGSTPAYRPVLEHHGYGELGDDLYRLSRGDNPDRWSVMAGLIDRTVVDLFAVEGSLSEARDKLRARADGLWHRINLYPVGGADPEMLHDLAVAVTQAP